MRFRPICKNKEFSRVYAKGRSFVTPQLVLYARKTNMGRTRVGLTATKKIGTAVVRNRARRVMRAALAEVLPYNAGGWDLVFVARGATARMKSTALQPIAARLLCKAGVLPADTAAAPKKEPLE